jgi:5-methylcytosine-specific restriction enzyme subunit McrC
MSLLVDATDLSAIKYPAKVTQAKRVGRFLTDLQHHLTTSNHVVRLGSAREDDEPVISRDPWGQWRTGRYIGDIRLGDQTLRIRPRLGPKTITEWLGAVTNIVATPESSDADSSSVFVAELLALLWCRAVDQAARHGPPAFRADRVYEGLYVRGALDVRGTAALRARGSVHLRSTARFRELDNDVARTLVAAERVLTRHIGHDRWRTPRVRDLSAQLVPAVGARPALPQLRSLQRQRYTPITRPYRQAALVSHQIASQTGLSFQADAGPCDGLLLDVAELWELFLLAATRDAFPDATVEHGTADMDDEKTYLLSSPSQRRGMGRLKPDIVVRSRDGELLAVIDAKYKRLAYRKPDRPDGVDRADLYQLTSYLCRYDPEGNAIGALLYPEGLQDPDHVTARAQAHGPWSIEGRWRIVFETVPVAREQATQAITDVVARVLALALRP